MRKLPGACAEKGMMLKKAQDDCLSDLSIRMSMVIYAGFLRFLLYTFLNAMQEKNLILFYSRLFWRFDAN